MVRCLLRLVEDTSTKGILVAGATVVGRRLFFRWGCGGVDL